MSFTDPFPGLKIPLDNNDLVRALRLDLTAEEDAIHLYTAHVDATDNVMAKGMLQEVANDERRHVGVFLRLIEILTEDERKFMKEGAVEVSNKFPKLAGVGLS